MFHFGSPAGGDEPKRGDFGETWTRLESDQALIAKNILCDIYLFARVRVRACFGGAAETFILNLNREYCDMNINE